MIIPNHEYHFT